MHLEKWPVNLVIGHYLEGKEELVQKEGNYVQITAHDPSLCEAHQLTLPTFAPALHIL